LKHKGGTVRTSATSFALKLQEEFAGLRNRWPLVCILVTALGACGSAGAVFGQKSGTSDEARPSADVEEPVYEPGEGITPPRVVHQVNPKYDARAKGFRLSGAVLIGLIVSSRGLPSRVHVVRSLDKDVDESALEAVREWRFEPGKKNGSPVAVRVTIEIRFHDL
jgi:protein TonB